MGQMKMFKLFDQNGTETFNNLFGKSNVVCFNKANIVGVRYDYEHNRLNRLMSLIPFTETQQFMITPEHFVDMYTNIKTSGLRPSLQLDVELPAEESEELHSILESYKVSDFKIKLLEKLNNLEDEFNAFPQKISFFYNKTRVSLYSNGIFFGDDETLNFTDEILYSICQKSNQY